LAQEHALLTKKLSNEETKTSESSSFGSNDQSHITNPCDVGKKHVSTSCDNLDMPCSSLLDTYFTSMSYETNLLKENNELKSEVKNLSNKLERCYNSKIAIDHIMTNQRRYGDKSSIGYNKSKGKIMKKQDAKKLSQLMCYRCHEMGHIAKCCPTKKPQVEPKAKPQAQIKINHEDGGDLMKKKKKTRRGGTARHPTLIQDAKMMSKNQDEKKVHAHIKCFKCGDM
jgi:hypothetical protein